VPISCWLHEDTNSQSEYVTRCFSTVTMVERKCLEECYTTLSVIL